MRYGVPFKTYLRYFLLLFFVFLLIPTSFYNIPREGLDSSWNIAYHLAYKYDLVFGKDFLFTYGPLAILQSRYPIVVNLFVYLFFDLYLLGTFFFVLKKIFTDHFNPGTVIFVLLVMIATMYEARVEWYFFFFLFFIFSFLKEPRRFVNIIQAVLLSIICFYYKENFGTIAIVTLLLTTSYALIRKKIDIKIYALSLALFLLGGWLGSLVLHVNLKGYIAGSMQIIDGYNDAQFTPLADGYTKLLYSALFIILVFAAWAVYRLLVSVRRKEVLQNGDELFVNVILLANVFVVFKTGFTRADESHLVVFFAGVSVFTGFLYLYGPENPVKKTAARCCWLILLVSCWSLNTIPAKHNTYAKMIDFSLLTDKLADLKNYIPGIRNYNKARAASDLLETGNNELKKIIGDKSVDIIPSEISTIYFNGLRYNPRPVIQSYSAYNEYLDSLNYEKYMSPGAPDYILFTVKSIDDRYAFFDEPKTKLAIFDRYEMAGEVNGNLVLRRKAGAVSLLHPKETEVTTVKFGRDIPLKTTTGLQYSRFLIGYSVLGKIRSLFYSPPLLKVVFTLANGETRVFRGIKPILKEGVIINKYVENTNDFQLLMQSKGLLNANVCKIRIGLEETHSGFQDSITMINTYYPLLIDEEGGHNPNTLDNK